MYIAGCIVLYRPDMRIMENILCCVSGLERLYVIDNSETRNYGGIPAKLRKIEKCSYIWLRENKGIAYALNFAAELALYNGYEWLLMLDQDTCFPAENIEKMQQYIVYEKEDKVKVIAGLYYDERKRFVSESKIQYMTHVITAGSMVELKSWDEAGGFLDKLFIDEVDTEFCFRIILNGYKIVRLNNVIFKQSVGNQKRINGVITFNYPPFRYYYIVRNQIYVYRYYHKCHMKRYYLIEKEVNNKPETIKRWVRSIKNEKGSYAKKLIKYVYVLLGILDGITGNMGICKWRNL